MKARLHSFAARWGRPLAAAAFTGLVAVLGTRIAPHQQGALRIDGFGLALVALGAATVAIARRHPWPAYAVALASTAAYVTLGYPTDSPYFLGLLATAYLVPAAGARRRTAVFAVATLAVFATTAPLTRDPASWAWPALALVAVVALVAGQAAVELSARVETRARHMREEEAQRRLVDERLAIARELHDVVSHSVAMMTVQAGAALHVVEERPEAARDALIAIKAAGQDAMRDLRAILGLLREAGEGSVLAPAPGLAQLPELVESIERTGVRIRVDEDGDAGLPAALPVAVDLTAYRVVQEALTNVVRHAPGASARVSVSRRDALVVVEVENDAPGDPIAEPRAGSGHGLEGMRERVLAVGGELEAGPGAEGGFRVLARLPFRTAGG